MITIICNHNKIMYASKYTITFSTEDSSNYLIMNPLSGAMDIVDTKVVDLLDSIKRQDTYDSACSQIVDRLIERQYIYLDKETEDKILFDMNKKLDDDMNQAPENFILSTTYSCNMKCKYCFQESIADESPYVISDEKIDMAFNMMETLHKERGARANPMLTVYGGEPLQRGIDFERAVRRILDKASDKEYGVVIITNGLNLDWYVRNVLIDYPNVIQEIHVTLDGTESQHNSRRPAKGQLNSFNEVVKGVDAALDMAYKINLRFVADSDNVDSLPALVDFIYEKGWHNLPHFTPHMGRICCGCPGEYSHNIMTTTELVRKLLSFYKKHPRVRELIPTRCMGLDNICATGQPYPPVFTACPGARMEFAFDAFGHMYPCSASMGKKEFRIGTFHPEISYNENYSKWRERNIFKNKHCSECTSSLYCGGGCPIEAYLEKDSFMDISCRPVVPTLKTGIDYFYPQLAARARANTESESSEDCC